MLAAATIPVSRPSTTVTASIPTVVSSVESLPTKSALIADSSDVVANATYVLKYTALSNMDAPNAALIHRKNGLSVRFPRLFL